jgi:hypothetical protein
MAVQMLMRCVGSRKVASSIHTPKCEHVQIFPRRVLMIKYAQWYNVFDDGVGNSAPIR